MGGFPKIDVLSFVLSGHWISGTLLHTLPKCCCEFSVAGDVSGFMLMLRTQPQRVSHHNDKTHTSTNEWIAHDRLAARRWRYQFYRNRRCDKSKEDGRSNQWSAMLINYVVYQSQRLPIVFAISNRDGQLLQFPPRKIKHAIGFNFCYHSRHTNLRANFHERFLNVPSTLSWYLSSS